MDNTYTKDQEQIKIDFTVFFSNWKILAKILFSFFQFFIVSVVYYGISLNTDSLGGNPYLNFFYSALAELAGIAASQWILKNVGRRLPYLINFLIIGVSLIAIGFVSENLTLVVLFLIGKFSIAFNFNAIEVVVAESHPTVIRNSVFNFCGVAEGLGSTLSTYVSLLAVIWMPLPYIAYGVAALFAGVTQFVLIPETKDLKLPEDLADVFESDCKVRASAKE